MKIISTIVLLLLVNQVLFASKKVVLNEVTVLEKGNEIHYVLTASESNSEIVIDGKNIPLEGVAIQISRNGKVVWSETIPGDVPTPTKPDEYQGKMLITNDNRLFIVLGLPKTQWIAVAAISEKEISERDSTRIEINSKDIRLASPDEKKIFASAPDRLTVSILPFKNLETSLDETVPVIIIQIKKDGKALTYDTRTGEWKLR